MKAGVLVAIAAAAVVGVGVVASGVLAPKAPAIDSLAAGSTVRVRLLESISSGGTDENTRVPVLVVEDVLGKGGNVAIRKGSAGLIEVTRSRGATALTALANQPARLSIRFLKVQGVAGEIDLQPSLVEGETELELTRSDVDERSGDELAERIARDPALRETWEKAQNDLLSKGTVDLSSEEVRRTLEGLARDLEMPGTAEALRGEGAWRSLNDATTRARSGDLKGLAGADVLLALTALDEIATLAGSVDRTLRGVFKGRNITAPIGMEFTAKTAEDVSFTPSKG